MAMYTIFENVNGYRKKRRVQNELLNSSEFEMCVFAATVKED